MSPELPISLSSAENCPKFRKSSTPQILLSTPHTFCGNGQAASSVSRSLSKFLSCTTLCRFGLLLKLYHLEASYNGTKRKTHRSPVELIFLACLDQKRRVGGVNKRKTFVEWFFVMRAAQQGTKLAMLY